MKRVVIIVHKNFQDEELVYPYYRCLEEGYRTDIATPGRETMFGKYGVPARATADAQNLNVDDYDAVIVPGGFESPDRLRLVQEVLDFVKAMYDAGKLVAAICHGPWVCISAGILKGKRATAFQSIRHDMMNAGADYVEQDVVIDGHLITSPHYRNNGDFMKAIVGYLNS